MNHAAHGFIIGLFALVVGSANSTAADSASFR